MTKKEFVETFAKIGEYTKIDSEVAIKKLEELMTEIELETNTKKCKDCAFDTPYKRCKYCD